MSLARVSRRKAGLAAQDGHAWPDLCAPKPASGRGRGPVRSEKDTTMTPYDNKSKEWEELVDGEEARIRREFGCCPGPVDLWSSAIDRRGFLKVGMGGLLSLLFAQWLDPRA